jgi:hypothetical protein
VDAAPAALVVRFDPRTPLVAETLVAAAAGRPGAQLLPDGLRWPLADRAPLDALESLLERLASVA